MTKPVGIGLIGTGSIAQSVHLPAYKKLQDEGKVKIVAIADIAPEAGKTASEKFGIDRVFTDYQDLLKLPEIDAVDVCTPNIAHCRPTIDALEAGKHVLCEKPIARNAVEGQAMVEASRKTGKKLQVGLNVRFGSASQAVKRFINDGRVGEIYYARAHALRRRGIPGWGVFTDKEKQGGGPLIDIGVHILDLTLWLMGHPKPVSVTGTTYTKFGTREDVLGLMGKWDPKTYTVEDFAVGFVRFENGATLTLESSFVANLERDVFTTQLFGSEGGVYLDPLAPGNTRLFREESGALTDTTPQFLPSIGTHEQEIREFVQAVIDDTPVPVPGEQGLMVTRILDAIYQSAETGKEVSLAGA
jgi:predicted dehydrogenase